MKVEAVASVLSGRFLQTFVTVMGEELGADVLPAVLEEAGLPASAIAEESLAGLDGLQCAATYSDLQRALRAYYGRGARGTLLRIGHKMWEWMVSQANFREKAELEITRRLPVPARRRRVLDFVAERLREGGGSTSIHQIDLDLLLADQASAATCNQSSTGPICFVSRGIIQAALTWATGQEADVEEIACKAAGAPACEFKVTFGGKS